MPIKFVKKNNLPIGVDLGTSAVKMAQLRITENVTELLAAGSAMVNVSAARDFPSRLECLGAGISNVLKSNPFVGRQCILSMPSEFTAVQHVKIPKLPPQDIPQALQWELQGKLPFPPEEAVIRHVIAGEVFGDGESRQEVIVVAVDRQNIEECLKMAAHAGLEVVGVNIEAYAIVECFARLFRRASDEGRTILFVDIGAATTQVALAHGNKPVFARNLMIGGEKFDQAVAQGLKISAEQARALRIDARKVQGDTPAEAELYHLLDQPLNVLADELTQCLRYYESVFRNQTVERAIFVGGQAYDKKLCQILAQKLNLPAQIGDPLMRIERIGGAGLSSGLDRREPQPDWAVAVGLSVGAASAA